MLYVIVNNDYMAKKASTISVFRRNELASQAEKSGDYDNAIQLYEQIIRENRADPVPFQRLMILYRKAKEYEKELDVINRGIKVFKQQQAELLDKAHAAHKDRKKIAQLSNSIMKQMGLKDKKGNEVYQPEPVSTWLKRKALVEKKLGRA